jgi:hypothetical protein
MFAVDVGLGVEGSERIRYDAWHASPGQLRAWFAKASHGSDLPALARVTHNPCPALTQKPFAQDNGVSPSVHSWHLATRHQHPADAEH